MSNESTSSLAPSMPNFGLLSAANNEFTKDVYEHLAANIHHNAVISPLGLHIALALAFYGAEGSTADAMMKGLRIKHKVLALLKDYKDITDQLSKSPELKMANAIYFAQDVQLNPTYQQQAVEYFNSELNKTEFTNSEEAAKQMNDWVSDHTNGKIEDLIHSVAPDTKLVLINAIHFKGSWLIPFNPENTKDGPFYLDKTKSVLVPMMQMRDKFFIYQESGDDGFKVLELPYATREQDKLMFSMHIFLPNKRTGLETLEKKLFHSDSSLLKSFFKGKHSHFADKFGKITINGAQEAEVVVTLPRFKIESTWEMSDLCKDLGMNVAFTDRADFSHMTQDKMPLFIGQIVQKAVIEVNEEGTEASAATHVHMLAGFSAPPLDPPPPIYFTADHPFIVTISSISDQNILFIAKQKHYFGPVHNITKS